jgi:replicative DNA helicase
MPVAEQLSDLTVPYSLDAEQAVLGSIITDSNLMPVVSERLSPDCFHVGIHRDLFAVMSHMFVSATHIDVVTLMEQSVRQGVFDSQEEAKSYLVRLAEAAISPSSVERYAEIVEEKYLLRQLIYASKEIYELSATGSQDAQELLDFAEKKIYDIRGGREIKGLRSIKPVVIETIQQLSKLAAQEDNTGTGMSTSFSMLDKHIYGLNNSDLVLIAARPGMGKTSFVMNIAVNVAKKYRDKKIAVFSLEMAREQIVSRLLSSEARIASEKMRTGKIDRNEWKSIAEAADVLSQLEIYVDDTASISVGEMKSKLRRMKNLGLVIIDYLQLMSTGRRDGNRVNEVSEITRNLKIMAKELNVPVITLSQLSRGPESRPDKRPMLSDLRESGSIEQDADIVLFLYRNSYYEKDDPNPTLCECIIAKNRHGSTGTAHIHWEGQFTRFTDREFIHAGKADSSR